MKIAGIISEYNPFHNGHAYHIAETKKTCDAVVCVMSGDFVQRGEAAFYSKHLRAKAAVLNGADLVVELPVPYSCASAERFAYGGIEILRALGVVDAISFGAEDDCLDLLQKAASLLNEETFFTKVSSHLKDGVSFAKAREKALCEIDPALARIISAPNNLLAIEYLRFLPHDITPILVKRKGVGHDENAQSGEFASASFIRDLILKNESVSEFMPEEVFNIFNGVVPTVLDDKIVLSYLKRLTADDFKNVPDVTEGLENRIYSAVKCANTLDELYAEIKTKRYAMSRIRRILLNSYLGITLNDLAVPPSYIRVLAMNDTGKAILAKAKKASALPIITKPVSGKGIPAFKKSVFCSDMYSLFSKDAQISEWKRSPFILEGKK